MTTKTQTVPVTLRALIQRINRVLRKDQEQLKTSRGWQAQAQGDYYVHGWERNSAYFLNRPDVEAMGRKLGVLQHYEHVVVDERKELNQALRVYRDVERGAETL